MNTSPTPFKQKLSLLYLWLVPPATVAVGFGVGYVSYKIYLPVWALNVCLMIISAYYLGVQRLWKRDAPGRQQAITALLLILPWLMFSIFAGFGPPPNTIRGWINTATEQQIRYTILMAGGIVLLLGTALLKIQLQAVGEHMYSALAFAALNMAVPLFLINMAFWGYYLTTAFASFEANPAAKHPDWYSSLNSLFYVISVAEVILLYLGTLLFSVSLKIKGSLSRPAARWYLGFSLAGILFELIPPTWPQPFATAGFLVAIPAIPFIMYYLIGVQFLKNDRLQINTAI